MTTEEHLQRIKAKCEQLLAIAEVAKITSVETMAHHVSINIGEWTRVETPEIATFIASCAGPAEAGWCATIAAIEGLEELDPTSHLHRYIVEPILAAWPEELL